ncbi:unnamed protein product [Prunus armeniaca]|uniref:Uncharacterized protein n=1 Tax=Prunus armeniaca TaxID=36596 RepID=A0A6J5WUS9_PRUAR|nr:unnamed protein product [Prunus armeniaca]CAB4303422.1 unnamed protein product [Prunus armeniaca]
MLPKQEKEYILEIWKGIPNNFKEPSFTAVECKLMKKMLLLLSMQPISRSKCPLSLAHTFRTAKPNNPKTSVHEPHIPKHRMPEAPIPFIPHPEAPIIFIPNTKRTPLPRRPQIPYFPFPRDPIDHSSSTSGTNTKQG